MHWLLVALAPVFPMLPTATPVEAEPEETVEAVREEIREELPVEDEEADAAEAVREEMWMELPEDEEEGAEPVVPNENRVVQWLEQQPEPPLEVIVDPETLFGREPTAAAWRDVRNRMQTKFNALREGMRLPTDEWDINEALNAWLEDLDVFAEYALALASDDIAEITRQVEVLELLSEYLAIDYEAGNPVKIEATMRQMDHLLQRLEMRSVQADARAGRMDRWGYALFPADWGEPRFRDRLFADGLTFYSLTELSSMMRERHVHLARAQQIRQPPDTEALAREVVEIAHALARRQAELPDLSRPGFRNVVMRMEVISENIVDFSRARDRHGYNRQVFLLGQAIRDLDKFLQLVEAPEP